MCEVLDRVEQRGRNQGRIEGRNEGRMEGQRLLADAITRLNAGESAEHLIAGGMDAETVELALLFKMPNSHE